MSSARFVPLSCVLALAACNLGKTFENYQMPTGYAYLDTTPISSPHGYTKTQDQEDAARDEIAAHADEWKKAVLSALGPISSVLDMSQPIAVMAEPPLTPLNSAAANYTREVMIGMNYLTALPADTTQVVHVDAERGGPSENGKDKDDDQTVTLKLSIERDGIVYASRSIAVKMKPQESEETSFPTWPTLSDPVVPVKDAPAPSFLTPPSALTPSSVAQGNPAATTGTAPGATPPMETISGSDLPSSHRKGLAKPLVGQ